MKNFLPFLCFLLVSSVVLAEEPSKKVLYFSLSSGFEHSTVKSVEGKPSVSDISITETCRKAGIDVVCTKDGSVFEKDIASFDAFLFQTSGDLSKGTKEHPEWALTETGWKNLLTAVRNGKGFLGFHPATDSNRTGGPIYENSPPEQVTEYTRFIGAEFTVHGPSQETTIEVVAPSPIPWLAKRASGFRMFDEWYVHKNFNRDLHVLAVLQTKGMNGEMYRRPPCPIVWGRHEGKGRVFYSGFGHYDEFWKSKEHESLILDLIRAAIGILEADLSPNIDQVTPGAGTLIVK